MSPGGEHQGGEKGAGRPDPDERLVGELRELFAQVDPVPELVTEAAKAALGWRRLDADLATLLSDSMLEDDTLALARGASASVRAVSFSADRLTVDLEIHDEGDSRTLLGQLSPPAATEIEVQRSDGPVLATGESDQLGRFRLRVPAGGLIRLRVVGHPDGPAAGVETSWMRV